MINWVTLTEYYDPIKAHFARIQLEANEIPCQLKDEQIVSVNPLYANAVGGIKLQVPDSYIEKALEVIREMNELPYIDKEGKAIQCPKCGGTDVTNDFNDISGFRSFMAMLISFAFSVWPLYKKEVYYCKSCKRTFGG